MSEADHVEALKAKHAALENAIEAESQRPHPDDIKLHELKREKLKLKDEIMGIDHH